MGFGGLLEAIMIVGGCLLSGSLASHSSGFAQPTFSCIEPGLLGTVSLCHLSVLFDVDLHDRIIGMQYFDSRPVLVDTWLSLLPT